MTRKSRKSGDKRGGVHLPPPRAENNERLDMMEADISTKLEEGADISAGEFDALTSPGAVAVPGLSGDDNDSYAETFATAEGNVPPNNSVVTVTAHLVDKDDNPEVLRETLQKVQTRNQELEQELNRQKLKKKSISRGSSAASVVVTPVGAMEPEAVCVDGELDGSRYDDHEGGYKEKKNTAGKKRRWALLVASIGIVVVVTILVPTLLLLGDDDADSDGEDYDKVTSSPTEALPEPSASPTIFQGNVGTFVPILRINCGNDRLTIGNLNPIGGRRPEDWINDSFFDGRGSEVVRNDYNFFSTELGFLYETARQQISDRAPIVYTLPVDRTGLHAVQLHFVEADNTTVVGQHVFDVFLQDENVLADFDIQLESADYYRPVVETLFAEVRKGEIRVELNASRGLAKISGIGVYSFG